MADREKVIKWIEVTLGNLYPDEIGKDHIGMMVSVGFLKGVLELLKEQQPKKGHWQPYKYGDDTWHQCSVCGIADKYINIVKREGYPDYRMVSKRNFCPICGADMRKDGGKK